MAMRLQVKNLADVFGWMNYHARNIAHSFGDRIASKDNIAKVMEASGKINSMMGPFEMAARAMRFIHSTSGSTGRPFKPFNALLFHAPELSPR
jgi:hypothetical protein